ncbi:MAG TPA: 50S ribosomal protein L25 [Methylomirabilota bacterium]|nr:50S ribosomal protein L25 [Methylomirabilota bacterium]
MKSVSLTAFPRTVLRRNALKKLRRDGRVPAVIYGSRTQPQSLEVKLKDIANLIHHSASENLLIDLKIEGSDNGNRLALVQQVQHDPLTAKVLHVDFHEVAETEHVTIMVPVETLGEAVGVKVGGGVLEHVLFKVRVRALPKDLPEVITVDVTNLTVGQTLHVEDLPVPEGVEVLGDRMLPVISVAAPRVEAVETVIPAGAAAQPEMIKEKKEEPAAEKPGKKK